MARSELQSSDGESVKIKEAIEHLWMKISEDNSEKNVIPVENVTNRSTRSSIFHPFVPAEDHIPSTTSRELTRSVKQIELQSSNGESVKVEKANANQLKTPEDNCTENVIPMIVLQSCDGELFQVEDTIARQSKTISLMIDEDGTENEITLANVTSKILAIVIEYCKKHHVDADSSSSEEDLKKWDAEFMERDQTTIFEIILASNYLNIKDLHGLACRTVADMIKGKSMEQIREHFQIKNNFTPEEQEQHYRENPWVFD